MLYGVTMDPLTDVNHLFIICRFVDYSLTLLVKVKIANSKTIAPAVHMGV